MSFCSRCKRLLGTTELFLLDIVLDHTVQWYQIEAIGLHLMKSEKLSLRQIGCEIGQFPRWLNFACYNAAQMLKRHFLSQLRALTNCITGTDIWGAGSLSGKNKWNFSTKSNLM